MGDVLLNKYRVERVLGRGGMGLVVAVRHLELDELFAVKLMLPEIAVNAGAVERFLREARAAAKLKGDHVAKVHDVGRLPDGAPYMVMEYLAGADLKAVVEKRGPLPVEEVVAYLLQACETLGEAHALGIVHRDVKPANMFLTQKRNGTPCLKVLDFGISKYTTGDGVGLTVTAAVGGSPLYMSPEQMRSVKHVDARTDIWSLGIVFYELLTATTPFVAESITAVAGRVLTEEPMPPSRLRPDIPPSIDAVVLRCLARGPDDRFPSMEDLSVALRAALAERGEAESGIDAPTLPTARRSQASIQSAAELPRAAGQNIGEPARVNANIRDRSFDSLPQTVILLPGSAASVSKEAARAASEAAISTARRATTETTTGGFGQSAGAPRTAPSRRPRAGLLGMLALLAVAGSVAATFVWFRARDATAPVAVGASTTQVVVAGTEAVSLGLPSVEPAASVEPAPTVVEPAAPVVSAPPPQPVPTASAELDSTGAKKAPGTLSAAAAPSMPATAPTVSRVSPTLQPASSAPAPVTPKPAAPEGTPSPQPSAVPAATSSGRKKRTFD